MEFKNLGDWCKWLEKNFSNDVMIPTLPVIIRLDGNGFSKWTKGLEKPFDDNLTKLMVETTKFLVKETNAIIGYTQSDEITLVLYSSNRKNAIYNDGKKQKILSKLNGLAVQFFNEKRKELLPNHNKTANFDCRIYQTPTLQDACAQLLWRENDATKNSILMLSQDTFGHSETQNLKCNELQDKMMTEKNLNWNDLPINQKRGTYVKGIVVSEPFTAEEIEDLPEMHQARKDPNLLIVRKVVKEIEMPILNKIENLVDVVFFNAEPLGKTDK